MFYDRITIDVRAGRGGDGSASFRREAHVPRGGADGGDGGDGGDVVCVVEDSRRDLAFLRRRTMYAATDGGNGQRRKQHGKRGDDIILPVPRGTQLFTEDGRKVCDLTKRGERVVIAHGGPGGRGNTHFVSSVRRAPAFAEIGLPGDEMALELRLKLMADAALIGLPNAGKSSLLRRISNARPKVGDYPFTTIAPVLGTIEKPDGGQIVVIDVPGLLEGASLGYGMGHQFLPHFERARLLLHTIEIGTDEEIKERFRVIQNELWAYDPRIARLPQIVVLTKQDLFSEEEVEAALAAAQKSVELHVEHRGDVFGITAISSATGQGLPELLRLLMRAQTELDEAEKMATPGLRRYGADPAGTSPRSRVTPDQLDDYRVYTPRPKRRRWRIYKEREGFRVTGDALLQAMAERAQTSVSEMESLAEWLEEFGAIKALRMAGAGDGTEVTVCGVPFELW